MKKSNSMHNLRNYTVLYVEDNKDISEEIAFFLETQVKELYLAYDGKEGVDSFLKYQPDIIITDVQMPRMNGLDMIETIREKNSSIPIIITTAFNESGYLLEAINLNVDAYQVKPLNLKELMKSLMKVVEPIALRAEVKQKNEQIANNNYYLEQFKHAVNEASIFSACDEEGNIREVNDNFELISGYTREEAIGKSHNLIQHEGTPKELYEELWRTIKSGKIWKGLIKNKNKDGKAYYVISEIAPIHNKDGSFKEFINISNDVTELEEYKQLLKHELSVTHNSLDENVNYSKQYEEAINSKTAIIKTNQDNIITYVNAKFCELSGYKKEEIIGQNCNVIRNSKYKRVGQCEKINTKLLENKIVQEVSTNITKDGEEYIVDNLFYPISDLEGDVVEHLQVMNDLTELMRLNEDIVNTQKEVVLTMGAIGETRSRETGVHVRRVAEFSYLLAKLSGMSEEEAALLKQASPMHDIGKVGIPDNILNKEGKLTEEEFEVMKTHATIGYDMLNHSERPIFKASALVSYTHHEKWNGSGYPNGLKGEEIHIYGRITAIADVFDALGHDRVYKKAWELEDILEYFKKEEGKHFDPTLVKLFFENLDKFLAISESMTENIIVENNA